MNQNGFVNSEKWTFKDVLAENGSRRRGQSTLCFMNLLKAGRFEVELNIRVWYMLKKDNLGT